MLKPDPLGARLHTRSCISGGGCQPPSRIHSLALSESSGAGGDRGRSPGWGWRGKARLSWSSGGQAPPPPHGPRPGPRSPTRGLARGRAERPVAWSISGLPGGLRGASRSPRSYLRERRCAPPAATPWKPQGCPRTAARRQEDRLRCEPRPRRLSRDAGAELDWERGAGRLEGRWS